MVVFTLLSHNNDTDRRLLNMNPEEPVTINCPYCGESQIKMIDLADMAGQSTEDCEVCCQPMILALSMDENRLIAAVTREDE